MFVFLEKDIDQNPYDFTNHQHPQMGFFLDLLFVWGCHTSLSYRDINSLIFFIRSSLGDFDFGGSLGPGQAVRLFERLQRYL